MDGQAVFRGDIYYWNGSAWEEKTSPVKIDIRDMEILTAEDVWAIGGGNDPDNSYQIRGTILHLETDLGGETQPGTNTYSI